MQRGDAKMKQPWRPKFKKGNKVYALTKTIQEGSVYEVTIYDVVMVDYDTEAYFVRDKRDKLYRVAENFLGNAATLTKEDIL